MNSKHLCSFNTNTLLGRIKYSDKPRAICWRKL